MYNHSACSPLHATGSHKQQSSVFLLDLAVVKYHCEQQYLDCTAKELASTEHYFLLQFEACWIWTNILFGKQMQVQLMLDMGILPILVQFISKQHSSELLYEQVCVRFAAISAA